MIVVTTPTGNIGTLLVHRLLESTEPIRVIVRDAARLDASVRERVEVVEGTHADPATLDTALSGADALFWLVPPNPHAPSAIEHYLGYARAAAATIRRHTTGHVVAVTSAGHGWPKPAGQLSAAFAMDAELQTSGAAYRGLAASFFMENLTRHLPAIRDQGVFALPNAADRPLATIANRDIAAIAATLLTDRSWTGAEILPVFGPDHLTPEQMAETMTDVLGRPVTYQQDPIEDTAAAMAERGWHPRAIQDMTEMYTAQNEGLYDADEAVANPTSTDLHTWLTIATARP